MTPTGERAEAVRITGARRTASAPLDLKGAAGGVSCLLDEAMQAKSPFRRTPSLDPARLTDFSDRPPGPAVDPDASKLYFLGRQSVS